jgi:hypothetical protein
MDLGSDYSVPILAGKDRGESLEFWKLTQPRLPLIWTQPCADRLFGCQRIRLFIRGLVWLERLTVDQDVVGSSESHQLHQPSEENNRHSKLNRIWANAAQRCCRTVTPLERPHRVPGKYS